MRRLLLTAAGTMLAAGVLAPGVATADTDRTEALPPGDLSALCEQLYGGVFDAPTAEPLAACQWDMALIGANSETFQNATGAGVRVGVIDGGVDTDHADIAPNLDLDASCSFIYDDTPTAGPGEAGNGDCSNKAAVEDLQGHGTHVASTIAAPVNGVGIAGVAPEASIVALKACTIEGYCFADSVAAALRYAGDQRLDVVNLSLFADPYLYYCGNDAEQRAILRELQAANRYAQQRGVLVVSSAGNESSDLRHPGLDDVSPDWPPGSEETRDVGNNCRVAPAELTGVVTVSATGPVGYPGYDLWIADYSTVGVDVTAPGGDYFQATGTVQDAILAAVPTDGTLFAGYDPLGAFYPGITSTDAGSGYAYLNGTSMSSPHAAGVAALLAERHPNWAPGALKAALQRTAEPLACPADWEPLGPGDERDKCYGGKAGWTSFFGHGMVNAANASRT